MRTKLILAAIVTVVLVGWATSAKAEPRWPILPGQYGSGYYILVDPRLYPRERLPHFALFPPVYYSMPVPRTYGYSPFAYPPGYLTPEIECPIVPPATIKNPYVPPKETEKDVGNSTKEKVTQKSLRIINPYVTPSSAGDGIAGR